MPTYNERKRTMERILHKIAEALLDASFEDCEAALSLLGRVDRDEVVRLIFKKHQERCAGAAKTRAKAKPVRITAPKVRIDLWKCKDGIFIDDGKKEERYSDMKSALRYAELLSLIAGEGALTHGLESNDFYAVRRLVPKYERKAVNVCISAIVAVR